MEGINALELKRCKKGGQFGYSLVLGLAQHGACVILNGRVARA